MVWFVHVESEWNKSYCFVVDCWFVVFDEKMQYYLSEFVMIRVPHSLIVKVTSFHIGTLRQCHSQCCTWWRHSCATLLILQLPASWFVCMLPILDAPYLCHLNAYATYGGIGALPHSDKCVCLTLKLNHTKAYMFLVQARVCECMAYTFSTYILFIFHMASLVVFGWPITTQRISLLYQKLMRMKKTLSNTHTSDRQILVYKRL